MKLKQIEVVRTVGVHKPDDKYLRIRVPRLMVKINHEKERIHFDTNVFVNDIDCKVYPAHTIVTQNYITVPRASTCDLYPVSIRDENDEHIIPNNTPLICLCLYDHNKLIITDPYEM